MYITMIADDLRSPHNFALHGPLSFGASAQQAAQFTKSLFFFPVLRAAIIEQTCTQLESYY